MDVLAWNCRGFKTRDDLTVPYTFWLISKYRPSFLFLQETKSSVDYVKKVFCSSNPSFVAGVDAQGASGGLVLFCWGSHNVDIICSFRLYIFCKVTTSNGKINYLLFLYGEPRLQNRPGLLQELKELL